TVASGPVPMGRAGGSDPQGHRTLDIGKDRFHCIGSHDQTYNIGQALWVPSDTTPSLGTAVGAGWVATPSLITGGYRAGINLPMVPGHAITAAFSFAFCSAAGCDSDQ